MRKLHILSYLCAAAALSACGGGDAPPGSTVVVTNGIASLVPAPAASAPGVGVLPASVLAINDASSCFNPDLYADTATIATVSRTTLPGIGSNDTDSLTTNKGGGLLSGVATKIASLQQTITPDAALIAMGREVLNLSATRYFNFNPAAFSLLSYGNTSQTTPAAASSTAPPLTSTTSFTPYVETSYLIGTGKVLSQSYTENVNVNVSVGGGTTTPTSTMFNKDVLFTGIETVEVPAGKFQACKFIDAGVSILLPGTTPKALNSVTRWVGIKNGLTLKTVTITPVGLITRTDTTELLSASINGVKVTP